MDASIATASNGYTFRIEPSVSLTHRYRITTYRVKLSSEKRALLCK